MTRISEKELVRIRTCFPPECRITLDHMGNDPFPVPDGSEGTVQHVDDLGTVHVLFDNGRRLGLVPGEDRFHVPETSERDRLLNSLNMERDAFFFDPDNRFVMEVFFEKNEQDKGQFVCGCLPFEEILAAGRDAAGDPAAFFRLLDITAYRECVGLDADIESLREVADAMQEPADYLGRSMATMVCLLRDTETVTKKDRTPDRNSPVR